MGRPYVQEQQWQIIQCNVNKTKCFLIKRERKKKNKLGMRKMPEGEMVQIVSLANHESKINAGEKLNQRDYFLRERKHRLPLPPFTLSEQKAVFVCCNQPASLAVFCHPRKTGGRWPPSPASLLHKPAPTCQICLKFGCLSPRPAVEVAATQPQTEITGQAKGEKDK